MVASIFEPLVVKPIFNLLVFIYGILPGHNFGLSIIIFTVIIRLLMWPVVKKQLHQAKAMRELQPELKRIKKATSGNRQQESLMLMELYKERGISPFGSLGTMVVQLIILISLYAGLRRVVNDPHALLTFSYDWLHNLPWLKSLAADISRFDGTLFGIIDLKRATVTQGQPLYIPGLVLVLGSAVAQFYQSKQLLPQSKEKRSLRTILKDASDGKQADQSEVNAAVGSSTRWLLPIMIIFFTISLPAALSLYWLTGGLVAYLQQARILGKDEQELEALADAPSRGPVLEGEVVSKPKKSTPRKKAKRKGKK